jgi:hypothetical protein
MAEDAPLATLLDAPTMPDEALAVAAAFGETIICKLLLLLENDQHSQTALEALWDAPTMALDADDVTDATSLVAEPTCDEAEEARDDVADPTPPPTIPPFDDVAVCDALDEAELSSNKNVGVNACRKRKSVWSVHLRSERSRVLTSESTPGAQFCVSAFPPVADKHWVPPVIATRSSVVKYYKRSQ